jgi:Biotin-lipoyl like
MSEKKGSHVATEAFNILRTLYQLSNDLFASENRQDLNFRMLNNTYRLFAYNRAVLWSFDNKHPKLIGVSGQEDINHQSPLVRLWKSVITSLKENKTLQILSNSSTNQKNEWQTLVKKTSGLSVMWVPMIENGKLRAALWIERWGEDVWDISECEIMNSLAQNFSTAWKQFNPLSRWRNIGTFRMHLLTIVLVGVSLIYLLYFQMIPLRVVAPCEIVPKDPEMIAAPLEGVIKQILVQPGEYVKKGDLLFTYEDRIINQELKVAQKQVQIIRSQYDRSRLRAFKDDEAIEEIKSLQYRLEQEKVRLKMAESNAKHLEVQASTDGICMVHNPEYWRGRPVQIGERVVMLFQPGKSKLKIFLPENDNIRFDRQKPIKLILNADPSSKYEAVLNYVAIQTSDNPQGGASFIAEAELTVPEAQIKVGSKGSAIVYGEEVRMGYWLLRKPLASIRHFLGL